MANAQDLQKIAVEMNYVRAQAEQLQQQAATVSSLLQENRASKKALENLGVNETLFPIGSGAYVQAKPTSSKVLVEIGSGVVVEKTPDEAQKLLDDRHSQLVKALDSIQDALRQASERLEMLNEQGERMQR